MENFKLPEEATNLVKELQHQNLLHVIIEWDKKEDRKHKNIYRIGIALEALSHAENNPKGLIEGINNAFSGILRDKLLKAIKVNPKDIPEKNQICREDY